MDYSSLTRKELTAICKEKCIIGYSKKNKQKIIEMIQEDTKEDTKEEIKAEIKADIKADTKADIKADNYTKEILNEQYILHKNYINIRKESIKKSGIKVRLPSIPEDISENIIKYIIHNKLNDKSSSWNCKNGDLQSKKEGKQECKCFTSDAPTSFTPNKSIWDVIYFLDARKWLDDKFICYRIEIKNISNEWKNIKISEKQTFNEQCIQGRRPRISWSKLYPQIEPYCKKIYEGTFNDIFIPLEVNE
jgi:hypothetical protein